MSEQVQALQRAFATIASTRMKDVPVQNTALSVEAVGFEPATTAQGNALLLGVLVTPWFMSLVRLPQQALAQDKAALAVGQKRIAAVGNERFEFIGAYEHGVGAFEACSLFSPMFEFADHAAAVATAQEVLKLLRSTEAAPSRRGFLFGRGAAPARADA